MTQRNRVTASIRSCDDQRERAWMGPHDLYREQRVAGEEALPTCRLDAVEDSNSHLLANLHQAEDPFSITRPVADWNQHHKRETGPNRVWDK